MIIEHRNAMRGRLELRGEDDMIISGISPTYNTRSVDLSWFGTGYYETIAPGAARASLDNRDIDLVALWSHQSSAVLGRRSAGTLRAVEADDGVHFEIDLGDTQAGRDAALMVRRGDVNAASFGMRIVEDRVAPLDPDDLEAGVLRTITELELYEVSPVAFPAYPANPVSARSEAEGVVRSPFTSMCFRHGFTADNGVELAKELAGIKGLQTGQRDWGNERFMRIRQADLSLVTSQRYHK